MKNIYQLQCILNLFILQAFKVICQTKKHPYREKNLSIGMLIYLLMVLSSTLCKKILGKCIHIYPLEYIYCVLSSLFANIRLNLLCSAPKKNNLLRYWQGNFTRLSTSMA